MTSGSLLERRIEALYEVIRVLKMLSRAERVRLVECRNAKRVSPHFESLKY